MHVNKAHSLANLQDLIPTILWLAVLLIIVPPNIGIKSCRFVRECASFIHAWVYLPRVFVSGNKYYIHITQCQHFS